MGWRGVKGEIDAGMLFRKMYCKNCGTRLKIKKNSKIINKGDKGYTNRGPGGSAIGMSSYYSITYTYCCPNCGLEITYDEQCIVAKKQKKLKKKILNENE